MIKVVKFGGSSVANATQFKKVKDIVHGENDRRVVVTSACGKVEKNQHKITDLLYLCNAHITYNIPCTPIFELIKQRFSEIKDELALAYDISSDLDILLTQIEHGVDIEYLVSRGEYFTARLLSEYLGYYFVDAKDIIHFHYDGNIDYEKTKQSFDSIIKEHSTLVIPGFYGALPDGNIKLMTRGGSDITGSILANIMNADVYENWTDVSGILKADPRVVKQPKQIDVITYRELRELSYMGASVLHEEAIYPVRDKNIPIHILNTNRPSDSGTIIIDSIEDEGNHQITGIAGKKDFSIITIQKAHMQHKATNIKDVLTILERFHIGIEHLPTGIDSFSVIVDSKSLQSKVYDVIEEIRSTCKPDDVSVQDNISLIAVVSRFMKHQSGMSGRLFTTLGDANINISVITQTSDEMNIIVGVDNDDYKKTIRAIYQEFIVEEDKA